MSTRPAKSPLAATGVPSGGVADCDAAGVAVLITRAIKTMMVKSCKERLLDARDLAHPPYRVLARPPRKSATVSSKGDTSQHEIATQASRKRIAISRARVREEWEDACNPAAATL
jgi:hypothetical protein